MSEIDWSKAPEGATHATPKGHNYYAAFWRIVQGTATDAWVVLPDGDFDHVLLPALFERDRKELVERPSSPAWSGEGLPPVGTHIEWFSPIYGWLGGRVVGHDGSVTVVVHNDGYTGCHQHAVRPIRTPEQIAAEDREKAVEDMLRLFGGTDSRDTYLMQRLYDAGYRKTEGAK